MKQDITNLKGRASVIKNATEEGENTALRVGSLLEDMIDSLQHKEDKQEGTATTTPIAAYRWYQKDVTPSAPIDTNHDEPLDNNNAGYPTNKWLSKHPTKPSTGEWVLWVTTSIKRTSAEGNVTRDAWTTPVAYGNGNGDIPNIDIPMNITAKRLYVEGITPELPADIEHEQPWATDHTEDGMAKLPSMWTTIQPVVPEPVDENDHTVWHAWSISTTKHLHGDGTFTLDPWSNLTDLGVAKTPAEQAAELPQELEEEVENIRQTIRDVEAQLDDIHIKSKQDVQDAVDEMFDTWDWFIAKGFPVGEVFNYDNEDFRGAIGETISGLGYLKDNDNGVTYTKLKQFINGNADTPGTLAELTTSVGDITRILDPNDPSGINYETLGTEVSQKITQDVNGLKEALLDLQAFRGITNEDKELMQYMKSAFSAAANQYHTAATMFSDMEDAAGRTATSAVKTAIGIDANGNLVSGGLLASKIQDGVNSATAGVAYQSDIDDAFAQMFAKAGAGETDDPKHTALIAAVRTAVNTDEDGLRTAIGSLVATPDYDEDAGEIAGALAGVFVECADSGDHSLVKLIARNGSKNTIASAITLAVKENKASLELTSSDVGITAQDLTVAVQNAGITAETLGITAESLGITASSLGITAHSLGITADDVTVSGNVTLNDKLTALEGMVTTSAEANLLHSWNGDITTPFTETSTGTHVVIKDGSIEGYKAANNNKISPSMYKFAKDGSGFISNGNIWWTADGHLYIKTKEVSTGTDFNVVDIYKWVLTPTGYDANNNPSPGYGSNGFLYTTTIGFRVVQNGFILKEGSYSTSENISAPTPNSVRYAGYIGSSNASDNTGTFVSTSSYDYTINSINTASALAFYQNLVGTQLFNEIFYDSEGHSLFALDDMIHFSFPEQILKYLGRLSNRSNSQDYQYMDLLTECFEVASTPQASNGGWTGYQSYSEKTRAYIMLYLDQVGITDSNTRVSIYNDLFYYGDSIETLAQLSVKKINGTATSSEESQWETLINNAINLSVNCYELKYLATLSSDPEGLKASYVAEIERIRANTMGLYQYRGETLVINEPDVTYYKDRKSYTEPMKDAYRSILEDVWLGSMSLQTEVIQLTAAPDIEIRRRDIAIA